VPLKIANGKRKCKAIDGNAPTMSVSIKANIVITRNSYFFVTNANIKLCLHNTKNVWFVYKEPLVSFQII